MAIEVQEQTPAARAMGVLEAIRTRRSVGKMRRERPPREAIEAILEAATWAPNHRMTEPWRFIVLAGEARQALGSVMAETQAAGRSAANADATAIEEARAATVKAATKPLRAPVVIAVAVEPVVGPKIVEIEEIATGAAAVQNMLLAAHALGLAAIWRTGGPSYDPAVKAFFGLTPAAHLLGFVYIGYPDGAVPERVRTPAARFTQWLGWDDEETIG
jgi:nitroreductase